MGSEKHKLRSHDTASLSFCTHTVRLRNLCYKSGKFCYRNLIGQMDPMDTKIITKLVSSSSKITNTAYIRNANLNDLIGLLVRRSRRLFSRQRRGEERRSNARQIDVGACGRTWELAYFPNEMITRPSSIAHSLARMGGSLYSCRPGRR